MLIYFWTPPKDGSWLPGESIIWLEGWNFQSQAPLTSSYQKTACWYENTFFTPPLELGTELVRGQKWDQNQNPLNINS